MRTVMLQVTLAEVSAQLTQLEVKLVIDLFKP